jgi:hypothetical protein
MSTRYYKNKNDGTSRSAGYEGSNIPDDFNVPSCTIEDVDRALFDLFDKQLPFTYKHKEGTKRAPVIFASGERFAVLRRKEPLRDKSGALVLPLVSIMRTGISQVPTMGAGTSQNTPHVVKRKLSKDDPEYQRLLNKRGLRNSDDLPSKNSLADPENPVKEKAAPGKNASRRDIPSRRDTNDIGNPLGQNIYEIIEIPPPKYFTASYEITLWSQYTLQMNDMITALMSLYQSYSQRTFQLETDKGYWFVGYAGEDLNPGNNFDDFTDSERIVRYTFTMTVPGYLVNPQFPGSQNGVRRYVSAPEISFDAILSAGEFEPFTQEGPISGNPSDHVLEDLRTVDEPLPGQQIGSTNFAASDSRGIFRKRQGSQSVDSALKQTSIGGTFTDDNRTKIIQYDRDPFTGKKIRKSLHVKNRTNRMGETVLRETLD